MEGMNSGNGNHELRRLAVAIVGFMVGQLIGDKAMTLAKAALWILARKELKVEAALVNAALVITLVLTAASAVVGVWAQRHKRVYAEPLLVAAITGVVTAAFTIVDYGLPATTGASGLRTGQAVYFLLWVIGLWFLPAFGLPNPNRTLEGRVSVGYGMLATAAGMTVIGLATGLAVEKLACVTIDWCDRFEQRWVSRPVSMNAICGALVVVACAPMWWHELQWKKAWRWTVVVTMLASVYSGVWGVLLYRDGRFGALAHFENFAALPIMGVLGMSLAYAVTQRGGEKKTLAVGWRVTRLRWLLPVVFGVICTFNAVALLAPIEEYKGAPLLKLALMHGANGVVIAVGLMGGAVLFSRLLPDLQGDAANTPG